MYVYIYIYMLIWFLLRMRHAQQTSIRSHAVRCQLMEKTWKDSWGYNLRDSWDSPGLYKIQPRGGQSSQLLLCGTWCVALGSMFWMCRHCIQLYWSRHQNNIKQHLSSSHAFHRSWKKRHFLLSKSYAKQNDSESSRLREHNAALIA